jgi:hypothetical protein
VPASWSSFGFFSAECQHANFVIIPKINGFGGVNFKVFFFVSGGLAHQVSSK